MSISKKASHSNHWLDSWHVNPSVNREYDFIDGLRGIAILMVVCCHILYLNPQAGAAVHFAAQVLAAGAHGVELFFALSGFLISWPFWKRKMSGTEEIVPKGYARRRFWKLYPPLVLSVIVFTPVYFLQTHDWQYFAIAAQWLAGTPVLFPVSGKFNPVMWTLVIEAQFYIALPLVFIVLKRMPPKVAVWIIPLIFFMLPVGFRAVTGLSPAVFPNIDPHFPSALDSFTFGILIAGLDVHGALKKGTANLGGAGFILWLAALFLRAWMAIHSGFHNEILEGAPGWMEKIGSGLLLCYAADPRHPLARLLCAPWLRWCGIISYEWYLFHLPIAYWVRDGFGPASGSIAKYAAIVGGPLLGSTILAALIYRKFSLPILKFGRASRK